MVTIGMNYKVLPGKGDEFVQKFRAVLSVINETSGHEKSNLFQDVDDPRTFLIVSNWSELNAFQNFIQSQSFKDVTSFGKENILAERPSHKVYKN
jgi:heme-degrading monooxygenase HmoA